MLVERATYHPGQGRYRHFFNGVLYDANTDSVGMHE